MAIIQHNQVNLNVSNKLRSVPYAADRLGVKESCVRSWIYQRKIPYVKVGRAVRISEATIEEIIARGTVPALERD